MHYQPIFDIAELCALKGVTETVLCPGSRCAPLTLAFTRHPRINTRTFSDERSAGFVALGIAQQKQLPVAMICTSGSAAYNFAPAVSEAYFSETPLIIFTADRPSEWIGQHDGQTIFQPDIFGKHVKKSFQLPQDYDHADSKWAINRIVNDAINLAQQEPKGPVHINTPFREPLYPQKEEKTEYSGPVRTIDYHKGENYISSAVADKIREGWTSASKILIVVGQQDYDAILHSEIGRLSRTHKIPVVCDIISNMNEDESFITHSDLFLGQASDQVKTTLQPTLLITMGKSLVSKNLKLFLRKYPAKAHWHIQYAGLASDPFKNLTDVFAASPTSIIRLLNEILPAETFESQKQFNFQKLWEIEERRATRAINEFFPQDKLNEIEVVKELLSDIPDNCNLHLANSMSVRYANFIGLSTGRQKKKNIKVYANRGTSGIDGSTSTAIGHALSADVINILITGDVAFFYDRNAFWHNYALPNLRVLLLNNHGGVIFNMIDGPASQPEAAEYFITNQRLTADKLCEEFNFEHLKLDSKRKLRNYIKSFFEQDGRTKVLEVETNVHVNREIFDNLKLKIKNSYES
ncbi:MAG TPA: 2-succinyl-5-enolpyruvyl-6-hydroxy-3-cyclohexene-1-carboxylic-acid synthase [Chryseosolibacter sp.]|nr:2-succinyl-5-enolpyruvyl-6-hydroxy-3-cyclohexene-1-carboxylic-acid synthase [Chryseosolibacter sp.]